MAHSYKALPWSKASIWATNKHLILYFAGLGWGGRFSSSLPIEVNSLIPVKAQVIGAIEADAGTLTFSKSL